MKNKRKGNDINIAWEIKMKDGNPFSLAGKDVSIYLKTPFGKEEVNGFTVRGNIINWTFYGKDQKSYGKHSLELVINENAVGMITTDKCDFVNLVSCSCEEGGADSEGITTETIELTSTLEYVAGGMSEEEVLNLLDGKVDKVEGLGLSEENYTADEKEKLAGLENYDDSGIKDELAKKAYKSEIPTKMSQLEQDIEIGSDYDETHLSFLNKYLSGLPMRYEQGSYGSKTLEKNGGIQEAGVVGEYYYGNIVVALRGIVTELNLNDIPTEGVNTGSYVVYYDSTSQMLSVRDYTAQGGLFEWRTYTNKKKLSSDWIEGGGSYDDTEIREELSKKLEGEVVGTTTPTEGSIGGSYDDTEIRQEIAELSEEINGKVFFQTDVLYKNQQFKIFEKLEKGKAYTFLSSVPCGIEYYTESGKYVHLFDAQTEIEFICPYDYDETKSETLKREGTENGTMLIKDSGLADKQQELIEDVGALAEQTSQIADSLLKRKDLVANEDYQVLQGQVNINGILYPNDVNYWRSSPIEVKRGDVVYLTNKYKGSGMAIGRTDADGNYYHLLVSHNDTKDYRVEITFDGYIAIGYINGQLPTQFYIETSSIAREKGKAENYADFNLAKEESAEIGYKALEVQHETHFTNLCIQARFERGKMVAELATLTDDDILAQGSCGYTESNGQITDGTIQWRIYKGGLLHIFGYGKMYDFVKGTEAAKSEEEVHQKVRDLGAEFWYYGFVNENVNGIVPPFPQSNQKYETDEVMNYSNKRYVPFGEEINPLNGKPYGYSAPWYIYRVHVDDSYTSYDLYKQKNPNGITYNRILIEEDASKGGITYIGNWAFYRVSADSLILPAAVTKIGCWGVRYSPVLKTLIMGDNITTIEDHGVSRMEAMEAVKVSSKLVSLGYAGMDSDAQLKMVDFPSSTTLLGSYCFNGCGSLQLADFGSIQTMPMSFATLSSLVKANIPNSVESIGITAFYKANISRLVIPSNVLLIETDAFRNVEIKALVIESQEVLNKFFIEKDEMTMQIQQGALVGRCNYILIPTDLTMSYALEKMFVYIGADDSYKYYKRDTDKLTINL